MDLKFFPNKNLKNGRPHIKVLTEIKMHSVEKKHNVERTVSSINGAGKTGQLHVKE